VELLLDRREEAVEVDVEEGEAVTTPASKLAGDPGAVGLGIVSHGLLLAILYSPFVCQMHIRAIAWKGLRALDETESPRTRRNGENSEKFRREVPMV
jgi:hypothetical protein